VNSNDPIVRWTPGGKSFLILDVKKFSEDILPNYFKHSKFTSFNRQLNFYGFRKIRIDPSSIIDSNNGDDNADNTGGVVGGKKTEKTKKSGNDNIVCFHHEFFHANEPKLLHKIQRTTKQAPTESSSQIEFENVKNQMEIMKNRMGSMTNEFEAKLIEMKASIELDYLRRVNALEMCYKELISTIIAKESFSSAASCRQTRNATTATTSPTRNSIVAGTNNTTTPEDYLVGRRMLTSLNHRQVIGVSSQQLLQSNKLHFITTSDTTGDLRLPANFQNKNKQIDTSISNKVRDTYLRSLFFPNNTRNH
jgi:hypothetical protein